MSRRNGRGDMVSASFAHIYRQAGRQAHETTIEDTFFLLGFFSYSLKGSLTNVVVAILYQKGNPLAVQVVASAFPACL